MSTTIATAIPYEQMGLIKSLYYRFFPHELTLEALADSLNDHALVSGLSGSGKSRFEVAWGRAAIDDGHSL